MFCDEGWQEAGTGCGRGEVWIRKREEGEDGENEVV